MQPNREEQLVIDSLNLQGYKEIVFEPDGNVPPDILVNGKIAIEVRRLNQNHSTASGFQGLEQDEFTLHGSLRRIMKDVSDKKHTQSAFVGYRFIRPLPDKKLIKEKVTEILVKHKTDLDRTREYVIDKNLTLTVLPSTTKLQQQYQYGMSNDGNSGGFVVGLIHNNLQLIVQEKEQKTLKYLPTYPE